MATNSYPAAFAKFNAASKAAVRFANKNWTNSAITRERIRLLQEARAELAAEVSALAEGDAPDTTAVQEALAQLAPHNADTVSVARNEWSKVKALLDSGRNFAHLIDNADRNRLAAILDRLPTEIATQSEQPDDTIREVENRVLTRLAELGDEKAKAAQAAISAAQHEGAWRKVIEQATSGTVRIDAWTALHQASPDEYRAALNDEDPDRGDVQLAIERLDHVASALAPEETPNDTAS